MIGAVFRVAAVSAVAIAIANRPAAAYPQYQLSRDQTCSGCHLSPAGGGLLTENGYSVAETYSQLANNKPEFMYGVLPTPSWLVFGGDVRWGAGYIRTPDSSVALFPMQADVYAHASYNGFSLHITVGGRPPQWITNDGTPGVFDRVWSREHYLLWQEDAAGHEGLFVRAGRFMPVFGLRVAEHPDYIRRYGGTPLYADTYGAAVEYVTSGWEAHLTGFLEDPLIDPVVHDSGVAAYAELRIDPRLQLGGEAMVTSADGHARVRGGATAKRYVPEADLLIQAELQVVHQQVAGGHAPNQIVGYAMASKFLGSAFLLDVGLGHYDENVAISGLDRDAVDLNLHWFVTSHVEFVWQNRIEVLGLGQSTGGPTAGWSLIHGHYRL